MIERLIEASIRNRFLVMFLAAAGCAWGIYAVLQTPLDAIPDLSENQVIVFTDWMGRSPKEIEDQITYPLSLKLQGLAGIKAVRSSSEFNFSMITLIFEDSIDFYFARQRVLEKLTLAGTYLPAGVTPYLAPDATALGQIYWYTIEGGDLDLERRWALQKFYIGPQLNSAAGVADVAAVGGAPREYQIDVRPEALRAYGITLGDLTSAVARSNLAVGGRVIQKNNAEYVVRSLGWIQNLRDIENTVIKEANGTPIYVKNIATVQLGSQFRRSVYEKDGNEVVGGVVMMRYGENPLAVTQRVQDKIQEMQPGLPPGVRIVSAYDRTELITGAIGSLREVMLHEMLIASLAVLLILMHVRSAFVICVTLPLAVLFSFLLMWVLRVLHIVDIQANIMSLAGITISIGILVDQAIVMTENATHHLKEHFGDRPVTGDTCAIVIPACKTVGRPIFFSVMIMLISFIPVFALTGREGKLFHPLAFTKSFALLGVALLSVTLVPALIPTFLKGRLKSEEENWIVRSFINVYKPVLTWALPRRNFVYWSFAVLLIPAAAIFPLQALLGMGANDAWRQSIFLGVLGVVCTFTLFLLRGVAWQAFGFVSLVVLGLLSWQLPKIGVEFMPALDEGSILDMPVTVPRASITQTADDLKARDALLRGFPEVETVIGKAGRADTPTDPAPLEMVETFVNFRPRELWPRRVLKYDDAVRLSLAVVHSLETSGHLDRLPPSQERDHLVNAVTMKTLERFDESMRKQALGRYTEIENDLGAELPRFAVTEIVARFQKSGVLRWPAGGSEEDRIGELVQEFTPLYREAFRRRPAPEDVSRLCRAVAEQLADQGVLDDPAAALAVKESVFAPIAQALGANAKTFSGEIFAALEARRKEIWRTRVKEVNWELFDQAADRYFGFALEEFTAAVQEKHDEGGREDVQSLRRELAARFTGRIFLWARQSGKKGDLVDDEMGRVLKVPGWTNIFTQPIINRIEMLSTGVRTDIGVKVFGPDLATIDRVCKEIERELKPLVGARDVVATQVMGKGYLEIQIDRAKAARYGINVTDIQDTIEVALGGRVVTQTVEDRERFPVRIRYARAYREDEEAVRRLLVSGGIMPAAAAGEAMAGKTNRSRSLTTVSDNGTASHEVAPWHAQRGTQPVQIPLSEVADVRITEGPPMIKSENGRLVNYVTLNVRGRDIVGFVEEAQRMVDQRVTLSEGVSIVWSGEFEHQVRAARTLRYIWPAVIVLIFVILYLTYNDLADAALMLLAVPEALAGGAFFQFLVPKLLHGWSTPPMDLSVAVIIGYLACFGMATETGIIMLVYLREVIDKRGGLEKIGSLAELRQAVLEGAVHRLRPKLLTEGVAIIAIAPMLFASGVGAEVIMPMAVPVLGGLLISDEVVDIFLPVRFYWVRRARWLELQRKKEKAQLAQPREVIPEVAPVVDPKAGEAAI